MNLGPCGFCGGNIVVGKVACRRMMEAWFPHIQPERECPERCGTVDSPSPDTLCKICGRDIQHANGCYGCPGCPCSQRAPTPPPNDAAPPLPEVMNCGECGRFMPNVDSEICTPCANAQCETARRLASNPNLAALRARVAKDHLSRGDMEAERARYRIQLDKFNLFHENAMGVVEEYKKACEETQRDLEAWDALIVEAGGRSCYEDEEDE